MESSPGNKYTHCLRFYENGTVISASIMDGLPRDKWFNIQKEDLLKSTYTVENRFHIEFEFKTNYNRTEYRGEIVGTKLVLTFYSSYTGSTYNGTYSFYPYEEIPHWDE